MDLSGLNNKSTYRRDGCISWYQSNSHAIQMHYFWQVQVNLEHWGFIISSFSFSLISYLLIVCIIYASLSISWRLWFSKIKLLIQPNATMSIAYMYLTLQAHILTYNSKWSHGLVRSKWTLLQLVEIVHSLSFEWCPIFWAVLLPTPKTLSSTVDNTQH